MTAIQATQLRPVTTKAQDILAWGKKFKMITRISFGVKMVALFALMYGLMFGLNGIISLISAVSRPDQAEAYTNAAGFNFPVAALVISASLSVFILNRIVEKRALKKLGTNPGW